jgi:hypothetical protein
LIKGGGKGNHREVTQRKNLSTRIVQRKKFKNTVNKWKATLLNPWVNPLNAFKAIQPT